MTYVPREDRYTDKVYRRSGRSGLDLPAVSLGLWQNFGEDAPLETCRSIVRAAFDKGVTHFDLANNYGPPNGAAETTLGHILATDLKHHRDETVVSTKAGWGMWPGPYGNRGSRKYMLASLDQSLQRLGLDYVDIFYSHRPVLDTPLEETMGALASAVQQGKALYVGLSSYGAEMTRKAAEILSAMGVPLLIHQPSYSMLNRWIEGDLLDTLEDLGVGCIAFSPLAQGLLTHKYIDGVPSNSRAAREGQQGNEFSQADMLTPQNLSNVRALNEIAQRRGQTLAQMAISWALRDPRVTSALIGARTVEQLNSSLGALSALDFSKEELAEIDRYAVDGGIDLWRSTSSLKPA
ncbi:L-glyceraldehyde 3-phosphate reductase [Agrobacterium tumefaciens]|uniref:L-glyceraldehyde 3-phosphate reductase n=1 Tax=Agrobacterium tumefaciens TaxID=358 RepID=UPI0015730F1B|nr:L-glyceraldehyde 3-phosphate reductase [Agrobacterium tumefaciens]NTE65154.1 L-glyceraldehyde 3-phosphate reductase [Agrobacterium tumefaciens]